TPAHGTMEGLRLYFGARVTFRCNPGFVLQGTYTATCRLDGTWSMLVEKKSCPIPEKPASGDYFLVYGPEDVLIAVQYLCHSPYMLKGQSQSSCLPNSTWSGPAPLCVKGESMHTQTCRLSIVCHFLSKPRPHSHVLNTTTCLFKDLLLGNHNLPATESERHRCPLPSRLLNGYHQLVLGLDGAPDTMEYFCNNSYALSGSAQRTCQADGSWSGKQPLCIRGRPCVPAWLAPHIIYPNLITHYQILSVLHAPCSSSLPGAQSVRPGETESVATPGPSQV
uniref:Sushi domain-containing protein n=1 Tax=Paramormyrops kingsleyae TaxID=1676925 RepID=A0A3B3QQB4_9TELE